MTGSETDLAEDAEAEAKKAFHRVDDDELNDEFSPFGTSTAAVKMSKSTASTHGPSA